MSPIGVILAAGMASRLRPLTDERPKCLLTVGTRTLLERTVDALLQAAIKEIVVVTGYRSEMIRQFLTTHYDKESATFHFIHNADYEHNNNIFSLWLARSVVEGRTFLLLDSDILFDPAIVARMAEQPGTSLALNRHELGDEEIKVVPNDKGQVVALSKTCPISQAIGESVGIEKIDAAYSTALYAELRQMIEGEGLVDVFYEKAFERLIPQGHLFTFTDTTDLFSMELDTVDDFNNARELIPPALF